MRVGVFTAIATAIAVGALVVSGGGSSYTCTTTLNSGADLSLAIEAATAGNTICMNTGSYLFNGSEPFGQPGLYLIHFASDVNVVPVSGATVSIAAMNGGSNYHLNFDGSPGTMNIAGFDWDTADDTPEPSNHLTFKHINWTQGMMIRVHGNGGDQYILVDDNTFNGIPGASGFEGRLEVRGYSTVSDVGVTIQNSLFTGNPGATVDGQPCSDGVQIIGGAYGVKILNDEFTGIVQGICAAHSDAIQLDGSSHTLIQHNYVHDDETGIMAPDGGDTEQVINNAFYHIAAQSLQFADHHNDLIQHNTFAGTTSSAGWCGHKPPSGPTSTGCVVTDNVFQTAPNPGDVGSNTEDYNLCPVGNTDCAAASDVLAAPVYVGGATPSMFAGFALDSSSPGYHVGSDGQSMGVVP